EELDAERDCAEDRRASGSWGRADCHAGWFVGGGPFAARLERRDHRRIHAANVQPDAAVQQGTEVWRGDQSHHHCGQRALENLQGRRRLFHRVRARRRAFAGTTFEHYCRPIGSAEQVGRVTLWQSSTRLPRNFRSRSSITAPPWAARPPTWSKSTKISRPPRKRANSS